MQPKVCIFGGTGFIGRHLCEHLYSSGIQTVVASVSPDRTFLAKFAPSVQAFTLSDEHLWEHVATATSVIHLGARSKPGTSWNSPTYEIAHDVVPVTRTIGQVIEVNPRCSIIFASSGGQIYGGGHTRPIPESAPASPPTAYALGKHLIEQALEFYGRTHGTAISILRIANPVGRWQVGRRHGFVSAAVQAALQDTELKIFGEGKNARDYFDVDDLAALLLRLATTGQGTRGVFNIGTGRATTELDVINAVERLLGRRINYTMAAARPFDLPYAVLDPSHSRERLGWNPNPSVEALIAKIAPTIKAIEDNPADALPHEGLQGH